MFVLWTQYMAQVFTKSDLHLVLTAFAHIFKNVAIQQKWDVVSGIHRGIITK